MILLVAVPGLAALKLVAVLATVVVGTIRYSFRGLGLFVGMSVVASLGLAYLVGAFNDVPADNRLNHLTRVASFYAVFAAAYWVRNSFSTPEKLDRLCLSIALTMASIKVAIWFAIFSLDFSLVEVMNFLGFETVTLPIGLNLFRLQFPSDFICLFLLAVYFGRRSTLRDVLFVVSVSVVIFFSFSRFIFICFFAGLIVRCIWLKQWDMIATFAALVLCGVLAVFGEELVERFAGEGSTMSDDTRIEQTEALVADIRLHPLLGRGIGAAVPNFSRSESLPFSYEVQWYATVMQFGWFGTLALMANVFAIVLVGVRRARTALCVVLLASFWIAAGFTNPFVTSIGSAVGLAIAKQRVRLA